ncbi:hypothetical protein [Streptomyces sp. NPDC127098]|uniref:hypothetical protein n=1 Tax=Streptomyces sp. NPDC127098 TaxID=3347137 RepID=UPI00365A6356
MSAAFRVQLSSSRRGAHLARQLAVGRLARHGIARTTPTSFTIGAITAELAANAVTHGRLPGRDFVLTLVVDAFADRWGCVVRSADAKYVWAEVNL